MIFLVLSPFPFNNQKKFFPPPWKKKFGQMTVMNYFWGNDIQDLSGKWLLLYIVQYLPIRGNDSFDISVKCRDAAQGNMPNFLNQHRQYIHPGLPPKKGHAKSLSCKIKAISRWELSCFFFPFFKKVFLLLCFCLRRSPDHGTVDVVVVLVVVGGTTLIFDFFQDTEIFIK